MVSVTNGVAIIIGIIIIIFAHNIIHNNVKATFNVRKQQQNHKRLTYWDSGHVDHSGEDTKSPTDACPQTSIEGGVRRQGLEAGVSALMHLLHLRT